MVIKEFLIVNKFISRGFLVLVLLTISYRPAFAQDKGTPFNSTLKFSINAGLTIAEDDFRKEIHEAILFKIHFPWFHPKPKSPYPELIFEIGCNILKSKCETPGKKNRFYWWHKNPLFRLTFGKSKLKSFIKAGPGVYTPREGNARVGFEGGIGMGYQISKRHMIEIAGDYHYIFLPKNDDMGKSTEFFQIHGGVLISL
ncbi:MAG TPA: hypothetical protein VK186_16720 [Candidatus Deferrimicrobium sp.]|nr:hypothetical protein [Candidatus Deferrimicrobium sp.]